jgi:hypothetical protein
MCKSLGSAALIPFTDLDILKLNIEQVCQHEADPRFAWSVVGCLRGERLVDELTQGSEILPSAAAEMRHEFTGSLAAFEQELEEQRQSLVVAFTGFSEVAALSSQLNGIEETTVSLSVSECPTLTRSAE